MRLARVILVIVLASFFAFASPAAAGSLSDVIPNLFGANGITLAPPAVGFSHSAHFTVDTKAELLNLNTALSGQLSTFPLPSPASGFTYQFDPTLGVVTRSTESFGPIFADRAETIGRGRVSLGFTYQHFSFDQIDGKDLHNGELQVFFRHEPTSTLFGIAQPFFFEADFISAKLFADITSELFVFTANYGLLDNLDIGIAIPIIRTEIKVRGVATINRVATADQPDIHRFADGTDSMTVRASDDSTGIGDIVLRGKYNFYKGGPVGLAAGLDLRLPSGDDKELRGLDTVRVSPFLIASAHLFGIAPHVNVGFDIGDTSKIENEFFYKVGFDWAALSRVTVAVDLLGRHILDNKRPKAGRPLGSTEISDSDIINAAFGVKINPWQNLLVLLNVLIPLNDTGLRDDITPLIGIEWSF
jgi:hypothetical protein